jgi:hypothetical protein
MGAQGFTQIGQHRAGPANAVFAPQSRYALRMWLPACTFGQYANSTADNANRFSPIPAYARLLAQSATGCQEGPGTWATSLRVAK